MDHPMNSTLARGNAITLRATQFRMQVAHIPDGNLRLRHLLLHNWRHPMVSGQS